MQDRIVWYPESHKRWCRYCLEELMDNHSAGIEEIEEESLNENL